MDVTDQEIGAYWDEHLAAGVAGIPDRAAVAEMRARYIGDVRANPEALRQIAEIRDASSDGCGCCEIGDFAPTDNPDDEPWCANCDHSPEEHE